MAFISFREVTLSELNLVNKIAGQLIVVKDTGDIYKDIDTNTRKKLGTDVEYVDDLPLAPITNRLYILNKTDIYIYDTEWHKLNADNIPIATTTTLGKVKPDGTTTTVDEDGTLHAEFDNSIELTQAEFNALSDEEKNNGTEYFITDANLTSTNNYNDLLNKPKINNVTLEGELTTSDLGITIDKATQSADGIMSKEDKTKLDGVDDGANKTIVVDNLTSDSSTSALSAKQGKILNDKLTALGQITYDATAKMFNIPAQFFTYDSETKMITISTI